MFLCFVLPTHTHTHTHTHTLFANSPRNMPHTICVILDFLTWISKVVAATRTDDVKYPRVNKMSHKSRGMTIQENEKLWIA